MGESEARLAMSIIASSHDISEESRPVLMEILAKDMLNEDDIKSMQEMGLPVSEDATTPTSAVVEIIRKD